MDDKLNDGVRTKTHTDRKERSKRRILGFVAVAALIAAIGVAGFNALRGRNSGGATLGGYDDMSREEIQAELDRQVEESMIGHMGLMYARRPRRLDSAGSFFHPCSIFPCVCRQRQSSRSCTVGVVARSIALDASLAFLASSLRETGDSMTFSRRRSSLYSS